MGRGMGLGPLFITAVILLLRGGATDASAPEVFTSPLEFVPGTVAVLSCNISSSPSAILGHVWKKGEKVLSNDTTSDVTTTYVLAQVNPESSGMYTCHFKTDPQVNGTIEVTVSPHVVAYKPSEHGNEGDAAVLTCKCKSHPPIETWNWYKVADGINQALMNGSDRFHVKSDGMRSELRITNLNIETDQGNYICNGTNLFGSGAATISLRVRSRLAALWPFLGIVAEVLVLVTVILIYEKRRKPDEVLDDDEAGAAPLKSNAGTNHKEQDNVRQRNSN